MLQCFVCALLARSPSRPEQVYTSSGSCPNANVEYIPTVGEWIIQTQPYAAQHTKLKSLDRLAYEKERKKIVHQKSIPTFNNAHSFRTVGHKNPVPIITALPICACYSNVVGHQSFAVTHPEGHSVGYLEIADAAHRHGSSETRQQPTEMSNFLLFFHKIILYHCQISQRHIHIVWPHISQWLQLDPLPEIDWLISINKQP